MRCVAHKRNPEALSTPSGATGAVLLALNLKEDPSANLVSLLYLEGEESMFCSLRQAEKALGITSNGEWQCLAAGWWHESTEAVATVFRFCKPMGDTVGQEALH